jgi:hypothetical protein
MNDRTYRKRQRSRAARFKGRTDHAVTMPALTAAAAAFDRAKAIGLVELDEETQLLLAFDAPDPAPPAHPDQLRLAGC